MLHYEYEYLKYNRIVFKGLSAQNEPSARLPAIPQVQVLVRVPIPRTPRTAYVLYASYEIRME
eukprot:scaffold42444_cov18-Prasinocladus_malaysianus.AAC.1